MYDRSAAARHRIASHAGPTARMYARLADHLLNLPDHHLRDRALLRLADSLDDAVALEGKGRSTPARRSPLTENRHPTRRIW